MIHQYQINIIYKLGPDLYIADWLSRQNQIENKDEEIAGLQVNTNATDVAENCDILCYFPNHSTLSSKIVGNPL